MNLEVSKKDNLMVVRIHERRLDARIATDFKSKLNQLVRSGNVNIVLNLSQVDFIDSSGLGALVSVLKAVGNNGEIKLCGVREGVRSIFELTRLDQIFSFHYSEQEAIDSFKS